MEASRETMAVDIQAPMDIEQGVPLKEEAAVSGKAIDRSSSQSVFKVSGH